MIAYQENRAQRNGLRHKTEEVTRSKGNENTNMKPRVFMVPNNSVLSSC